MSMSIRTHLLWLMLAVSVPLVATVGFGIYSDMQQSIAHTKTTLRTLANTMVSNTGGKIADARDVLERLALRPLIVQVDANNCDGVLKELLSLNPAYANIAYTNMDGLVVCSALPQPGGKPVSIGKTPWFQKFLKQRRFTVGQPFFGPITGKWVFVLSTPIWNARREMVGAVLLPLDLAAYNLHLPAQFLSVDSRYGFFSEDGTMIWRNLDPEGLIGTRPNADAARRIVEVRDGEFESLAADGVTRFFSVVPMSETGWIAFVGVPASEIYAAAKMRAITVATIVLAAIALLILFAIAIARRIARPMIDLERAARAIHNGDMGVRAVVKGPREIAAVAQEFNTMIEARQRNDAQLRIAATAFESQEAMMITDARGVIMSVNRAYVESSGYTVDEIVGHLPRLLRSSHHNANFYRTALTDIKRTGGWQGEFWDRHKNGEDFAKWVTVSAVRDDLGIVTHYVGTYFDITARKRAELALATAQRRSVVLAQLGRELAEAVTAKAAAIHILEASQQLLRWDSGWLHLSDEEQKNRLDLVSFDLIDGEVREVVPDMSGVELPTRNARKVKEEGPQLVLRDSESEASADIPAYGSGRRSLSLMFVPIRLGGQFIGIFSIQSYERHAYDQADLELLESMATHCAGALVRLQSVDALRKSEERYRSMVEWSPEAIAVHRDGVVIYVNPVAMRMFGATSAEELLGTPILDRVHIDFHQVVLARLKDIANGLHTPMVAMRYLTLDGMEIDVEVQSTSIDYDGTPAVHVAIRDITERRLAESARVSLESQLLESQKMQAIGTLAGGVAHDFNNILATIMGNVELARDDAKGSPRTLESLEEIRKAGSRARDLVQQILSFSRRQPTDRKRIALTPVVAETVRLLRTTLPSRVVLDTHSEPGLPVVLANATQIAQALINLVNNAVFAMHGGSGCIRIRLDTAILDGALADAHPALRAMQSTHPGLTVRLAVSDDATGMDVATLGRIFEPFFTTKAVDEGTGLGLSVVHGIVRTHEGAITVASQLGEGSTFTLYLPTVRTKATPEPDKTAIAVAPIPAAIDQRIIYIDDDESLLFLVRRLLERRGYRLNTFTNQREALDALRAAPSAFDLVVTDYNMPGMSGLDVAREVREIRADLPVVIASGFIDEALRAQATDAGVRELISKSNAVEELCEAFVRLAQTGAEKARSQ